MLETEWVNIASHLPAMALLQPHRPAVVFPHGRDRTGRVAYTHYTFKQLDDESDRLARGLAAIGIGRGTRTVLMVTPSLEFFALTFALFRAGAVPVMVDPGMGVKNLGTCLSEAAPEAFIGIRKAHLARVLLGWGRPTVKTFVVADGWFPGVRWNLGEIRELGDRRPACPPVQTRAEETAAILFTSGSTGVPKGAVYSHGIFASQVEMIRHEYGIEPGEIDLPTFPLFALFAPALGMTAIIPDMDATRPASVDPKKIFEAIENFGVTNMFGSPALLRRVGSFGSPLGVRLTTLRRVISAGAPMPPDVLEQFTTLLPHGTQVFTPYGATESLPVASIGSDEILTETRHETAKGKGVCVGKPVQGMTVRVIRITDDPIARWSDDLELPTGEIGELAVRGPVVTHSYYNRPQSTELAKIRGMDEEIWHRMGDVGYFDDRGRLWFCGRKSHRVITDQGTMFTIPCEGVFNVHPDVLRTALVGVARGGKTKPVLCVESRRPLPSADKDRVIGELRALGASRNHTAGIADFLFHPAFPVDVRHNAKIFREKLAIWAAKELS
ncbi:MAG: fatty acid CoA ligase family protein [Planctomycetota bacterium]